jgi:hypothetical protein
MFTSFHKVHIKAPVQVVYDKMSKTETFVPMLKFYSLFYHAYLSKIDEVFLTSVPKEVHNEKLSHYPQHHFEEITGDNSSLDSKNIAQRISFELTERFTTLGFINIDTHLKGSVVMTNHYKVHFYETQNMFVKIRKFRRFIASGDNESYVEELIFGETSPLVSSVMEEWTRYYHREQMDQYFKLFQ